MRSIVVIGLLAALTACATTVNTKEPIPKIASVEREEKKCETIKSATITGNSMFPFFHNGQSVTVAWDFYDCHQITRGEAVVIDLAVRDLPLVKTVVAIPEDTISFEEKELLVNRKKVRNSEGIAYRLTATEQKQMLRAADKNGVIKKDLYLVLGDNVKNTFSSRRFGPVGRSQIVGKVLDTPKK